MALMRPTIGNVKPQNEAVLGAMYQQHRPTKMSANEIIKRDMERHGYAQYSDLTISVLHQAIASGKTRLFRFGNTIGWLEIKAPHQGIIHIFSADSKKNIVQSVQQIAKALEVAGYTQITSHVEDQQGVMLAKAASGAIQAQFSAAVNPQGGFDVRWSK